MIEFLFLALTAVVIGFVMGKHVPLDDNDELVKSMAEHKYATAMFEYVYRNSDATMFEQYFKESETSEDFRLVMFQHYWKIVNDSNFSYNENIRTQFISMIDLFISNLEMYFREHFKKEKNDLPT